MLRPFVFFMLLLSLSAHGSEKTILILGDSLSAGYGIPIEDSWVYKLQARLTREGYPYQVINASISGETTQGVNHRLDGILEEVKPAITIVELGGNDGLRGFSLAQIQTNLQEIIEKISFADSRVVLVEMLLPPNYGNQYIEKFIGIYQALALHENVTLSQFILNSIADNPDLMQSDGIHPKAEAQNRILDNLWPALHPLLQSDISP